MKKLLQILKQWYLTQICRFKGHDIQSAEEWVKCKRCGLE